MILGWRGQKRPFASVALMLCLLTYLEHGHSVHAAVRDSGNERKRRHLDAPAARGRAGSLCSQMLWKSLDRNAAFQMEYSPCGANAFVPQ